MQLAWKTESVIYVLRSTYKLCRLSAHGSSRVIHASLHFTAVGSCGLPCVRRAASNTASSAFSRVSLTQIGHDAICWTVERCLCNTNFVYTFWLLQDFSDPSEGVKFGDGPNYFLIWLYYKMIITIKTTVYYVSWDWLHCYMFRPLSGHHQGISIHKFHITVVASFFMVRLRSR